MFLHSPYCSICAGIHPDWVNLSKKYKDDPKIMIVEIDCHSYESICEKSYKVKGYPSFVKILKSVPKKFDPGHDFDSLDSQAKELKNLKMDELCERYPIRNQEYPALVASLKQTKVQSCKFLDDLTKIEPSIHASHWQTYFLNLLWHGVSEFSLFPYWQTFHSRWH